MHVARVLRTWLISKMWLTCAFTTVRHCDVFRRHAAVRSGHVTRLTYVKLALPPSVTPLPDIAGVGDAMTECKSAVIGRLLSWRVTVIGTEDCDITVWCDAAVQWQLVVHAFVYHSLTVHWNKKHTHTHCAHTSTEYKLVHWLNKLSYEGYPTKFALGYFLGVHT